MVLLQQRQKWQLEKRSYQPGDLVLVSDIQLPRNQWALGRVETVKSDRFGKVRSATVKISKSKYGPTFSTSIIERPITKLILLRCFNEI